MRAVKTAVVGLGTIGLTHHCQLLRALQGRFELVAGCDTNEPRRALFERNFNVKAVPRLEDVLAMPEVELVVLATPSNRHIEDYLLCAQAKKHAIVEKPMALNAPDADRMIAAAKTAGTLLTVHHNRRWDALHLTTKAVLQGGYLGQLLMVKQVWLAFTRLLEKYAAPEFRPAWRLEAAYGGGMLYDYGPHVVDQALDLTGSKVTEVFAELRGLLWGKEVDDYFNVILRFENGVTVQTEASTAVRGGFSTFLMVGTKASFRDMFIFQGDTEPPQQVQVQPAPSPVEAYYVNIYEHLVNNAPLIITPEYARSIVAIIDACRKSSETRQVVRLG